LIGVPLLRWTMTGPFDGMCMRQRTLDKIGILLNYLRVYRNVQASRGGLCGIGHHRGSLRSVLPSHRYVWKGNHFFPKATEGGDGIQRKRHILSHTLTHTYSLTHSLTHSLTTPFALAERTVVTTQCQEKSEDYS